MKLVPYFKLPIRWFVHAVDRFPGLVSRWVCHGLYDGGKLGSIREETGDLDVLLIAPPMSDREGALVHPGVRLLQSALRHEGHTCEVLNYGLPVVRPADPYEHLARVVTELNVRILGVSLYSQAIHATMRGLQELKRKCPDLRIVLGGPHPTEAYQSLLGMRFIDFVVRGEAEESFPRMTRALLDGDEEAARATPGVFFYDRVADRVRGESAPPVDVERLDRLGIHRYELSVHERKQFGLYRGAHGLQGSLYWPISLVRGCPYACTYCAAHMISGKTLRYRSPEALVDEIEFYVREYGQRHFSFVDDSFTEDYSFVVRLCKLLLERDLGVTWATDNGIRYETLGAGSRARKYLREHDIHEMDSLIRLMIRAGWRGTSIGVESGSARVRTELVRKGGARLTNDQIRDALVGLKQVAREEGVPFYVNAYMMIGFPNLVLRNSHVVPGETEEEREETAAFALELRDAGAIDFALFSIVIPLPGTEMWDHLDISQRMEILLNGSRVEGAISGELEAVQARTLERYADRLDSTRHQDEAELSFWQEIYAMSDDAQVEIQAAYDRFNADVSWEIDLERPDGETLLSLRQDLMEGFYGGGRQSIQLLRHVLRQSASMHDFVTYLAFFGRTYLPDTKRRHALSSSR